MSKDKGTTREEEKKMIGELISELVCYDVRDFQRLPEEEQRELIGAYMLSVDLDAAWEILTEHSERYLPHIIAHHLKDGNAEMLMEQMIDAIEPYIRDEIQALMNAEFASIPERAKDAHTDSQIDEAKEREENHE
jgi:hypothetical protein